MKLCLNEFKAEVHAQYLTRQSSSPLTATSYFTSSTSTELGAATNKIIHWLSYIGTAELKTKAQSIGPIYYWWTDSLAVHCAVNVDTKWGTGLEFVMIMLRMSLAVTIQYLAWNNNHIHFDHCCEVLHSNKTQNRLRWIYILDEVNREAWSPSVCDLGSQQKPLPVHKASMGLTAQRYEVVTNEWPCLCASFRIWVPVCSVEREKR